MRLLSNCKQSPFDDPLTKVAESLLQHYGSAKGPLISILKLFINNGTKKASKFSQNETAKSIIQNINELDNSCHVADRKDYLVKS